MSDRPVITISAIIDAALDLVREGGWASVSARGIASRLGTSTTPIYSIAGSMESLKAGCLEAARRLFEASVRHPFTGKEALDIATGYVVFARDEPRLFRFVLDCLSEEASFAIDLQAEPELPAAVPGPLEGIMKRLIASGHCHDSATRALIFAHGLASLASSGLATMDDAEIIRQLQAAGSALRPLTERPKTC